MHMVFNLVAITKLFNEDLGGEVSIKFANEVLNEIAKLTKTVHVNIPKIITVPHLSLLASCLLSVSLKGEGVFKAFQHLS